MACATITAATVLLAGVSAQPLDLWRETGRLIVEDAAMAAVIAEREAYPTSGPILVNRPGIGDAEWQ